MLFSVYLFAGCFFVYRNTSMSLLQLLFSICFYLTNASARVLTSVCNAFLLLLLFALYRIAARFHASECVEICFGCRALVTWCVNNCDEWMNERTNEKKTNIYKQKKTENIIHFASFRKQTLALAHTTTHTSSYVWKLYSNAHHFYLATSHVKNSIWCTMLFFHNFRFSFNGMQQCIVELLFCALPTELGVCSAGFATIFFSLELVSHSISFVSIFPIPLPHNYCRL